MSDTSDSLEILDAIDRERGESFIGMIQENQVQRLRTEIVALRKMTDGDWVWKQITDTRDDALEEAAGLCELSAEIMQPDERRLGDAIAAVKSCAAAIRKLKEKA